jgi:hypothetical protein
MINLKVTEEELNTILQGLYYLEDQDWFFGKEKTDKLIEKLNKQDSINKLQKEALCDI